MVNLTSYGGVIVFGSYFNSKKEFKELYRNKNHPRFRVTIEELIKVTPQKGLSYT